MNEVDCSSEMAIEMKRPTIKEELIRKKERYEVMLKDIEEAITALESNPGVETVLNMIAKTGRY